MLGTQTLFLAMPLSYHLLFIRKFNDWHLQEKWFLTDYAATAGRILMIFSAVPHETEEMVKISHMARVCAHACNFCITILAKM